MILIDGTDPVLTPIEERCDILVKRDDFYVYAGQAGGKVRTCRVLAKDETQGLVTASARVSPQQLIVASIAERMGLKCRVWVPAASSESWTMEASRACGAEIIESYPVGPGGRNNVLIYRAKQDALSRGWTNIPFGMECQEAVDQTAQQVFNLPLDVKRIVVPVGSGMSLAGILTGLVLRAAKATPRVLGVMVGADPTKRLDRYAPGNWRQFVELVPASTASHEYSGGSGDYHKAAPVTHLYGMELDPYYEAKCIPFLKSGDLFWVVGTRYPEA